MLNDGAIVKHADSCEPRVEPDLTFVLKEPLRATVERLTAIGVAAGILATTVPDARRYRDWGYAFGAAGVDPGLFGAAIDKLPAGMKAG